jgi:phospholipid/cholesterol/gamma-HCH transport system substrate-binding protein
MKKDSGNKIRLGIFVSAALAFLIIGIYFIGQKQRLFARTFKARVVYKDVNGLQVGNNVRFSGINVGNVASITLTTDTTVEVGLVIDRSVRKFIKKNAQASVGSEGLMGDKLVNISPGAKVGEDIGDNDYLQAVNGSGLEAIMDQVKITATNAAHISGDLSDIVSNIHDGKGSIGKLFMDTVMAKNLDQTIVNVKQGTGGFKENMDAAKHSILFRGYFKKKEKEQKKKEEEQQGQPPTKTN